MFRKSCFSFLLLIFALLFSGATDAHACSCMPRSTVLDAYERAGFVIIARIVSVEKTEKAAPQGQMSNGENYVDGVKSTRMMIERVFKGSLKAGDEITFGQGGGADCVWTFREKEIGEQFLFYLGGREKNQLLWYAGTCGRSGGLKYVGDDLLYLNKLDRVRGKSRLSGTLRFADNDELSVEGRRIRITGAGKTHELKTDADGVYEIYDLPAGQYLVEPEIPPGWKFDSYYHRAPTGAAAGSGSDAAKKLPVTVEAKKHTALNLVFEIDNAIRGKVYDPRGRPLDNVCLNLVPVEGDHSNYFYKADCTEGGGMFEIREIPSGSYLLVVNKAGKISSSEPFKTFYHPDVFERERATVISIGAGETLEGLDIRAPHVEETITVEGVFLYSDGKPVVGESVEFVPGQTGENVEGEARAQTDAQGRFSFKILKGLEGELYGEMYVYASKFENCPKLEAIIKKAPQGSTDVKTPVMKIHALNDLSGVELRYPFPGCKKAKTPE